MTKRKKTHNYLPNTTFKAKDRATPLDETKQRCFSKKNGEQSYQHLVISRDKSYFVKSHSKSNNKSKQDEIIYILEFLILRLVSNRRTKESREGKLFICLFQVRVITVFTVFRLLTDFVCLYTYEH
jgi:hypothetical protein